MATIEEYELMEPLGSGGHGSVWLARERRGLGREFAIKRVGTMRLDGVARLEREAVLLSHLDHPAIVRVHDVVRDGAGFALVTELARGGSLAARRAEGPLAGCAAVGLMIEVADAVGSAHAAGVVHGDLKPSNILLSTQGRALVADFGVARWLDEPTGTRARPASPVAGTPGYAAPEVVAGRHPGPFSDVYSIAAMLAALVGDGPPRRAGDALDLPVSPALASVLVAALAGTAAQRYPNASTFASALAATPEARGRVLRSGQTAGLHPSVDQEAPVRLGRQTSSAFGRGRWTWRWTAVVVAAAIAGAAVAWLVIGRAADPTRAFDGQVAPALVHS